TIWTSCRSSVTRCCRGWPDSDCASGNRNTRERRQKRMATKDDDDDRPKKKIVHEIGQDLALLSVKELQERIALLKEEIARLEASIASKQASRSVADTFFKK